MNGKLIMCPINKDSGMELDGLMGTAHPLLKNPLLTKAEHFENSVKDIFGRKSAFKIGFPRGIVTDVRANGRLHRSKRCLPSTDPWYPERGRLWSTDGE